MKACALGRDPGHRSRRRAVLAALACGPFLVRAQISTNRKRLVVVGFPEMFPGPNGLEEVVRILAQRGLAEGRQIEVVRAVIDPSGETSKRKGLDYLVPEIERKVLPLKPDVIVTVGSIMTKGLHVATRTIPIVTTAADPVALGVAASLARPGGNVTGLAQGVAETSVKTMEVVKALVPHLARVAIFHDARPVAVNFAGHYERAARTVGLEPVMVSSMDPEELIRKLRSVAANRVQAGVLAWPPEGSEAFIRSAIAVRLPLLGLQEHSAEAGCIASYYASEPPVPPRLAPIVDQVLRGADAGSIPFQYPQTFRLVINLRAAAALGIKVPAELIIRADRVIE